MREATDNELQSWDELVRQNQDGGDALQTRAWGEFKKQQGWQPHYIIFDELKVSALFLSRNVPLLGDVWYCPKGPGVSFVADMAALGTEIKKAHPQAFVVKAEPEIVGPMTPPGWVKSPFDIHISQATYKIEMQERLDDMLVGFKQKTRYNINLADKKGVRVRAAGYSEEAANTLYSLIEQTQQRNGFMVRSRAYCLGYWKAFCEAGQGQIFLAEFEGKPIAGAFVMHLGTKAWYKDGGSDRQHSSLMAPYVLQWEIIKWLHERQIRIYDLVGIPRFGDETSPLKGLIQFKSGFNGHYQEFIGTWDLPLDDWKYKLWRSFGERLLLKYYTFKHQLWY
jgi:peptidoglycan pentaglycine glycine transferase (the first glycine)